MRKRGVGGRDGGQILRSSFVPLIPSSSSARRGMHCSDLSTPDPGPIDRRREKSLDNRDSENDSFPEELRVLVLAFSKVGDSSFSDDLLNDQDLVSFNFSRSDLLFRKLSRLSSLLKNTKHVVNIFTRN